jgi:hypothetical protein
MRNTKMMLSMGLIVAMVSLVVCQTQPEAALGQGALG